MKNLIALFILFLSVVPSYAAEKQDMKKLENIVADWLDQSLANSPGTASYQIGQIDSRIRLDACKNVQIALPSGYRLLGKTMLRVRCIDGARWAISVPVQVAIHLTYYVAARPLRANAEINAGDLAPQEGDLATVTGSVILDPNHAIGRILNSAVAAGNPIRQEMLRKPLVIKQRQKVKIIFRSGVIEVVNEGSALSNAMEGEPVRVQVSNGQTVSGIARADGSVDVAQ